MDSSSLLLSCSKRSVLNNGQLEFIFKWSVLNNGQLELLFQVVSPKQWTTWVYLHFPKKVSSPASSENEMSLNPSHHYQISFPGLTEHGITNIIPHIVGIQNIRCSFPALSEHGISTPFPALSEHRISIFIPRCVGTRNINVHSPFVGGRNVKSVIPSVSGPEMSPIKMYASTNHQFTNTFQISQYNYQHGSGQSFFPVKLQYPLAESDPFLQRIWVSLFIQNKSSLSFYIS